jgi:hypothetical protein
MENKLTIKDFMSRKPRLSFFAILAACIGISLIVTQVQANIAESSVASSNNPHYLPDEFNPKLQRIEDKIQVVKLEIKEAISKANEEIAQDPETIHSIAFKGKTASSKPTYDYTTGSSN